MVNGSMGFHMNLSPVHLRCPDRNLGVANFQIAAGTRKAPPNYTVSEMSRFPDFLFVRFPNP